MKTPDNSIHRASMGLGTTWTVALLLTACGGGHDSASDTTSPVVTRTASVINSTAVDSTLAAPSPATIALHQEGAQLNTAELEAIAKNGVLPKAFDGPMLSGADASDATDAPGAKAQGAAPKSAASRVPVYRFFNTRTSAPFFTTSATERDTIRATLLFLIYEGAAFFASATPVPGLSPVHRFYNSATGVHFYTISETERAHIAANLPVLTYEGIAYYASTLPGPGYTPLYRFFNSSRGFHFYTTSRYERDNIVASMPQYSLEGTAYYTPDSTWQTPAVPHTGHTSNQCFQAGSDSLVACGGAEALALNSQQDGHRTTVNPMGYSLFSYMYLPIGGGGPILALYPATSCAYDNVTGLLWEGKEATGTRSGANTYSNRGDSSPNDTSTYVATVNAMRLCGQNDWRLPSVEELHGIVNYGVASPPAITGAWFPNTQASPYWSADPYLLDPISVASTVSFLTGEILGASRSSALPVRLVRGAPWSGTRHMIVSVSSPGDGPNNAVIDRKTGLTWRRCEQGLGWNGSGCVGAVGTFDHTAALSHAKRQTGWRLPNAKELASLRDLILASVSVDPDNRIVYMSDPRYWSSSPSTDGTGYAMMSNINLGIQLPTPRSTRVPIRLVLNN